MSAQTQLGLGIDAPIDRFAGPYEFLSNFFDAPMSLVGGWWTPEIAPLGGFPTVEHAFQAAKVEPATEHFAEHYQRIASATSPGAAKYLGSAKGFEEAGATLRKSWEYDKVLVMLACLRVKFREDGPLAGKLIATSPRVLIEGNTWGDSYWGVSGGKGKNMLGRCLMLVRAEMLVAVAAGIPTRDVRWVEAAMRNAEAGGTS